MTRRGAIVLLMLTLMTVVGSRSVAQPAQTMPRNLRGVAELREAFNRGHGKPRLLLLLSPT